MEYEVLIMDNTSMGFHTFSISLKMNFDDYNDIHNDFLRYLNTNKYFKRTPIENKDNKQIIGWRFVNEKIKGITWQTASHSTNQGYKVFRVTAVINPKAILECNYISAAQNVDIQRIETIFNNEARKISPLLLEMKYWSVNRVDYCLNIDLREMGIPCSPKQMINLIKRGNIPSHFKEYEMYDYTSHRKVTDKNSFYLKSKSVVINYYWKYKAITENHPYYDNRSSAFDVIRLEVQCKYSKLYAMSKKIPYTLPENLTIQELFEELEKPTPTIPCGNILSTFFSERIINKYTNKILRKGDYFTFETASGIVTSYGFRREKEDRLLYALEIINQKRSIAKAYASLYGVDKDEFRKSLRDLDEIFVNPVTIPRKWGIRRIPNLLRAYYANAYLDELIPDEENNALKHIENYLKGDI